MEKLYLHFESQQLRLPLAEAFVGPEEVHLWESRDISHATSHRVHQILHTTQTREHPPIHAHTSRGLHNVDLKIEDDEGFHKKFTIRTVISGRSYRLAGIMTMKDAASFIEKDADPVLQLGRVDLHTAERFENGAYFRVDPTREMEKIAERTLKQYEHNVIPFDASLHALAI